MNHAKALFHSMVMLAVGVVHAAAQAPHTLYVANQFADTISVVDGATFVVAATIPTGRPPSRAKPTTMLRA